MINDADMPGHVLGSNITDMIPALNSANSRHAPLARSDATQVTLASVPGRPALRSLCVHDDGERMGARVELTPTMALDLAARLRAWALSAE
jgi:hypothetical protein